MLHGVHFDKKHVMRQIISGHSEIVGKREAVEWLWFAVLQPFRGPTERQTWPLAHRHTGGIASAICNQNGPAKCLEKGSENRLRQALSGLSTAPREGVQSGGVVAAHSSEGGLTEK